MLSLSFVLVAPCFSSAGADEEPAFVGRSLGERSSEGDSDGDSERDSERDSVGGAEIVDGLSEGSGSLGERVTIGSEAVMDRDGDGRSADPSPPHAVTVTARRVAAMAVAVLCLVIACSLSRPSSTGREADERS